ncbi:heme-degrading domain-containing protein [Homoserinibacter sp. YIM 151385]|uniref:heme-degrading domain-containing protein n=1 Tax=Homoserinibacter sp. YIM 151385 TaxID=2985506 RepID=UPI0022F01653|nr:heme-degrading domain-containing protein [Homoserinibacter sp. YIM 151385]WBU37316.1 heme-degrading domain-containing protein [Homoserinibacter sp. YIM 151385]
MGDEARELLERIEAEERELVLPRFGLDEAWELGSRMREAALVAGHPVAIGISLGEQRAFHAALPGSSADNDGWLERKTRVARRYGRSSYGVGASFRTAGKRFDEDARLDPAHYAAHGGVVAIVVDGVGPVGTVGISGLPQAEDHAFVVEHLRALKARLAG